MAIIDSYSESSYLADQVLADLPPLNGNFTGSCSDSSYFISTLRAHIWQTSCGQIYPPIKWWFHRLLLWCLIFHSFSEGSYLADQVLADLPPLEWQFQIPVLTVHISCLLWELIFGRSGVGRYTPHQMAISQIPALTVHISFSVLSAHIWQTRMGRSTPPPTSNSNYRFLIWELIFGRPSVGRSTPLEWQFHWFLLWQLIFHFCSESSYLADQLWTDLSPHQMVISQIAALMPHISFLHWGLIFGRPGVGNQLPASNSNYRFLFWELIFGRPSVGRSTPVLMAISHIAVLTAHISFLFWEFIFHRPGVADLTPHIKQQL